MHDADRVLLVRPLIRWALDNRIVATDPGSAHGRGLKVMGVERRKLTVRGVGQKWVWAATTGRGPGNLGGQAGLAGGVA